MKIEKLKIENILQKGAFAFLGIFTVMCVLRFIYILNAPMFDRDGYLFHYENFEYRSFYEQISFGTSIIFFSIIRFLKWFVTDNDLIIRLVNIGSVFIMGGIAAFYFYKNREKSKLYLVFMPLYFLYWINDEQLQWTNNDIFMSVFVMLIYLLLFVKFNINKIYLSLLLGITIALVFNTRPEFILLLIPAFIYYVIVRIIQKELSFNNIINIWLIFIIVTLALNYPSIKENKKISFFKKNPGISYEHINALGTLRMFDEGKIQILRKEIYETWDNELILKYQKNYHIKKLPNNIFEFIVQYPIYYIKIVLLNVLNISLYLLRRYGFFLVLPFFKLIYDYKKQKREVFFNSSNMPFFMFLIACFTLLFYLNTVIEFRWFDSFEFLLLVAIYNSMLDLKIIYKKNNLLNFVTFSSICILSLMNLRTIYNLIFDVI